jgi:hypothetical protein
MSFPNDEQYTIKKDEKISLKTNHKLDTLKELCKEYEKKKCVYKLCNNNGSMLSVTTSTKFLVVMSKCFDTKTNEDRKNCDKLYAKYRANKLKTEIIIDIDTLKTQDVIFHVPSFFHRIVPSYTTIYQSGMIIISQKKTEYGENKSIDYYDETPTTICSYGIHFFGSIDAAFYYRKMPVDFIGSWYLFSDNGHLISEKRTIRDLNDNKNIQQ